METLLEEIQTKLALASQILHTHGFTGTLVQVILTAVTHQFHQTQPQQTVTTSVQLLVGELVQPLEFKQPKSIRGQKKRFRQESLVIMYH
jgi:hypothetical protein